MSLKVYSISIIILLVFFNCTSKKKRDITALNEDKKIQMATYYHNMSNYFLQPSELYRTYKDSALLVQPNNVVYRQKLSYSYKKVGDHIKAMKVLNKAVDIDTANGKSEVLQYRAWTLLYYYRDYKGVVRDVDLIEKISKSSYSACWGEPCGFLKGQALYKLNKFEKAIETFKIVNVEENKLGFNTNDNYMTFFYMGRSYAELKEYNNAILYFEKSLASVKKFPEAYYQLGLVYKKLNKKLLANKNFELAENYINYSMDEPYVERFDEVFQYMIDRELNAEINLNHNHFLNLK